MESLSPALGGVLPLLLDGRRHGLFGSERRRVVQPREEQGGDLEKYTIAGENRFQPLLGVAFPLMNPFPKG